MRQLVTLYEIPCTVIMSLIIITDSEQDCNGNTNERGYY